MQTSINEQTHQTSLDAQQFLQLSKEIIARKNQDDTVIVMRLDESSLFYKIDGVAAQVWSKLVEPAQVSTVVSEFKKQYPKILEHLVQLAFHFVGIVF